MGEYGIDYDIAEKFFGWKWVAYDGTPVHSAPGYPATCRVRRFFPPGTLAGKRWAEHLKRNNADAATGDEPLEYAYGSSNMPSYPPSFSGDWNAIHGLEQQIRSAGRNNWDRYRQLLWVQIDGDGEIDEFRLSCVGIAHRCASAMALALPRDAP